MIKWNWLLFNDSIDKMKWKVVEFKKILNIFIFGNIWWFNLVILIDVFFDGLIFFGWLLKYN